MMELECKIVGIASHCEGFNGLSLVCSCSGDHDGYGGGTRIPIDEYAEHVASKVLSSDSDCYRKRAITPLETP